MDNGTVNVGKALTIRNVNGTVWGRSVPRRDGTGVVILRREATGDKPFTTLSWGPIEFAHKTAENNWELLPSYLVVTSVTYDAGTKTVTCVFSHNVWEGWNQVVTVPFGGEWRKAVCDLLISRSRETGSETHIGNFKDMMV